MINEHNIIDILILGTILSGFFGLLVAGHWQEIRAMKRGQEK